MNNPLQIISVILVIRCQNKFLLVQRSKEDDIFPGFWQNMGGKIEVGETVEKAISREMMEEVGLKLESTPIFLHSYSWKKDANGIHIISTDGKKDYHPDSDDLRNYSKSDIRAKALNNYKIRKEELKQQKRNLLLIKKAEKEGAMICLKDSIRSGNCQVGTINFANRHNLNPQKHYPPTQLLKIANGQADRVAIAVAVGLRRHYREMRQGFCEIANHI